LAFVFHLIATLMIGGFALSFIRGGVDRATVLVTVIGFVVTAGSLVFLTSVAIKDRWQPDDYSYSGGPGLPGPRAAWGSAKAWERILWMLFAIAFLVGVVLLTGKSVIGFALVVLSIPLALVAVRAGK
jgi:hypothetical protein